MLLLWNPWLWPLVMAEAMAESYTSHSSRAIGDLEKQLRECTDDIAKARLVWSRDPGNLDDNIWWARKYCRAQTQRKALFKLTLVKD